MKVVYQKTEGYDSYYFWPLPAVCVCVCWGDEAGVHAHTCRHTKRERKKYRREKEKVESAGRRIHYLLTKTASRIIFLFMNNAYSLLDIYIFFSHITDGIKVILKDDR